jgi:multicomponent Na+:H+ antiporter subunit A
MFMAAMLGVVLSDNLLLLFIFWELTSITSFFLIGFNNDKKESRKSAMTALSITGGGGFLLMAGLVLLGHIGGSYSIDELSLFDYTIKQHSLYWLVLFFVFAGAFTKSAQFPFHFWLPGAMKAPTPVSGYLHSATMVKAGVYLLARLTPVLGSHDYWNYTLMIVGGITMLYSAYHSIYRTDLKGVLAYSTISALGILVFLIGIGSDHALMAVSVFIVVHALYKAALFLIVGIIDHETGTRDITQLAGLQKKLPIVGFAGLLAALSSAGVPLTFGFIGKDLIYESTLHLEDTIAYILTGVAVVTNILLVYAGFTVGIRPFLGNLPKRFDHLHMPPISMWAPPLILASLGILYGLIPSIPGNGLLSFTASAIQGYAIDIPLKIWHGFNLVLLLSACTIIGGSVLFFVLKPAHHHVERLNRYAAFSPQTIISNFGKLVERVAVTYTGVMHNGYLRNYVLTIVSFIVIILTYKIITKVPIYINRSVLSDFTIYEVAVSIIIILSVIRTVTTTSRLSAVAALGVLGYGICLLYVFYSAPDLAMTQFTIDTLTVVLFVLVLFKLPPYLNFISKGVKIRDMTVSSLFGGLIALIALQVLNEPVNEETSIFYAENAYVLAKGRNVVNVILVDFRGFDTMFEIVVLTIAALGVYSLLKLKIDITEKE